VITSLAGKPLPWAAKASIATRVQMALHRKDGMAHA